MGKNTTDIIQIYCSEIQMLIQCKVAPSIKSPDLVFIHIAETYSRNSTSTGVHAINKYVLTSVS